MGAKNGFGIGGDETSVRKAGGLCVCDEVVYRFRGTRTCNASCSIFREPLTTDVGSAWRIRTGFSLKWYNLHLFTKHQHDKTFVPACS